MKKSLFLILLSTLILAGCSSQSEVDTLEEEISYLKSIIDDCNISIENAQSVARSDYEDMAYALEDLTYCDY